MGKMDEVFVTIHIKDIIGIDDVAKVLDMLANRMCEEKLCWTPEEKKAYNKAMRMMDKLDLLRK